MKRATLFGTVLILLVGMGTAGCYEQIKMRPIVEKEVAWVHCVLSPDSTQWLELRTLSNNEETVGNIITEAVVRLWEIDDNEKRLSAKDFLYVGDGLWRLDEIAGPDRLYALEIIRPGLDTMSAVTRMPEYMITRNGDKEMKNYSYERGLGIPNQHYSGVECIGEIDEEYRLVYEANGKCRISVSESDYPDIQHNYRHDRPRYRFTGSSGLNGRAVWIYKVGWSGTSWFVEDKLATDREDLADGYNHTGSVFDESALPEALSHFPGVKGQPLHYRYIHFPAGSLTIADTISLSGNFTGSHFGDACPAVAMEYERAQKSYSAAAGLPYADNIFTTGRAGYLNFKVVSEEYDRYLKDVSEYELLREVSGGIIGIYANTNTYTNIKGGTGIFGAEVDSKLYWSCGVWQY